MTNIKNIAGSQKVDDLENIHKFFFNCLSTKGKKILLNNLKEEMSESDKAVSKFATLTTYERTLSLPEEDIDFDKMPITLLLLFHYIGSFMTNGRRDVSSSPINLGICYYLLAL